MPRRNRFLPIDRNCHSYSATSEHWKTELLSTCIASPLDRVKVLGDDSEGHTGCVNALSWARDGELLLSGGDDTTVRIWRLDPSDADTDYPFVCEGIINTGHRANIFNAQMLPYSSRVATVAGDSEVRVFDINSPSSRFGHESTSYNATRDMVRLIKCHIGPVKRIVTEESPDIFLTVSEDGTVRQHDLRVPHRCFPDSCHNTPLIRLDHELYSLGRSPLTPYQLVVAGDSQYGYLFDRRHGSRSFAAEWGMLPDGKQLTTCVRYFGRAESGRSGRRRLDYITGAKMASSNGHEVLLSYGSDAVYLFSCLDDPAVSSSIADSGSSGLVPNVDPKRPTADGHDMDVQSVHGEPDRDAQMEEDIERLLGERIPELSSCSRGREEETMDQESESEESDHLSNNDSTPDTPIVLPRIRYKGACNVRTIKDVNFIGPRDEFVVSGSDEGYFFMWEKSSGKLHDILEGDSTVVNVIEAHPHLPLVAVSGIDTTVKLFAPRSNGTRTFSKIQEAEAIMEHNEHAAQQRRLGISDFLHMIRQSQDPEAQCAFQ